MNERLCPITGELLPVTDPCRIVSQTACNRHCFGAGFCARLEKNKWTTFECAHCKGLGSVHEGCVVTLVEELNKLKGEA